MKVAKITGVKLNSTGSGYVVKQSLKEGALLSKGDFLIVDLKTPEEILKIEEENKEADENSELSDEVAEDVPLGG
jgi:penicillin-binding protein 2B